MNAVKSMGTPALEPLLRVHPTFGGQNSYNPISAILSGLGVHDARILDILLAELKKEPSTGAGNLAEYGDVAALPHLLRALDEYQVTPTDSPLTHHAVIELTAAIAELGGELSPAQRAKVRAADEPRRRFAKQLTGVLKRSPTTGMARPKVGRNDQCPCGSGKKYKKCHLLEKD